MFYRQLTLKVKLDLRKTAADESSYLLSSRSCRVYGRTFRLGTLYAPGLMSCPFSCFGEGASIFFGFGLREGIGLGCWDEQLISRITDGVKSLSAPSCSVTCS